VVQLRLCASPPSSTLTCAVLLPGGFLACSLRTRLAAEEVARVAAEAHAAKSAVAAEAAADALAVKEQQMAAWKDLEQASKATASQQMQLTQVRQCSVLGSWRDLCILCSWLLLTLCTQLCCTIPQGLMLLDLTPMCCCCRSSWTACTRGQQQQRPSCWTKSQPCSSSWTRSGLQGVQEGCAAVEQVNMRVAGHA
jgi:hypothetical protein